MIADLPSGVKYMLYGSSTVDRRAPRLAGLRVDRRERAVGGALGVVGDPERLEVVRRHDVLRVEADVEGVDHLHRRGVDHRDRVAAAVGYVDARRARPSWPQGEVAGLDLAVEVRRVGHARHARGSCRSSSDGRVAPVGGVVLPVLAVLGDAVVLVDDACVPPPPPLARDGDEPEDGEPSRRDAAPSGGRCCRSRETWRDVGGAFANPGTDEGLSEKGRATRPATSGRGLERQPSSLMIRRCRGPGLLGVEVVVPASPAQIETITPSRRPIRVTYTSGSPAAIAQKRVGRLIRLGERVQRDPGGRDELRTSPASRRRAHRRGGSTDDHGFRRRRRRPRRRAHARAKNQVANRRWVAGSGRWCPVREPDEPSGSTLSPASSIASRAAAFRAAGARRRDRPSPLPSG